MNSVEQLGHEPVGKLVRLDPVPRQVDGCPANMNEAAP